MNRCLDTFSLAKKPGTHSYGKKLSNEIVAHMRVNYDIYIYGLLEIKIWDRNELCFKES
jgi:hypothetical protein